jgi:solute carrier family 45 protein 1/2/4
MTSFREIPLSLLEIDEMLRPLTDGSMRIAKEKQQIAIIDQLSVTIEDVEKSENTDSDDEDDEEKSVSLKQYLKSLVVMPKSMWILCLTSLLCWMCQLCYVLYFTDFVGEAVFHGDPSAPKGSIEYLQYEEGVRFGCWGMSIYALSCAAYAYFIERLIVKFKAKVLFIGALLLYSVAIGILGIWPTQWGVLLFSSTTGIVFATGFTIPFMLVANYHGKEMVILNYNRYWT